MASEKILNQKKEEVSKLAEEFKTSKIILLTDYRGINVEDVTSLRNDIRNTNSKYRVIKNNITRRALKEAGIEGLEEQLVGPTAVITNSEDYLCRSFHHRFVFSASNNRGLFYKSVCLTFHRIILFIILP